MIVASELFEQPAPGFQWLSGLRLCSARVGATVVTHGWLVERIQHQGNTSGQSTRGVHILTSANIEVQQWHRRLQFFVVVCIDLLVVAKFDISV